LDRWRCCATRPKTSAAHKPHAMGLPTGPLSFAVDNADFAVDATGAVAVVTWPTPTGSRQLLRLLIHALWRLTFRPRPPLGAAARTTGLATLTIKSILCEPSGDYVERLQAIAALSVSGSATALAAEDPLVNGGCLHGCKRNDARRVRLRNQIGRQRRPSDRGRNTFQNAAGTPATGPLAVDLSWTSGPAPRTSASSETPAQGSAWTAVRRAR